MGLFSDHQLTVPEAEEAEAVLTKWFLHTAVVISMYDWRLA